MDMALAAPDATTYDDLADAYDLLTRDHRHRAWIASLVRVAREHGLTGERALDVACGTGKSFLPLLELGFRVTGCDNSARMLELAARKAGDRAALVRADMRRLPVLGAFDLITCLNDSFNHLTAPGDARAALAGMRANLAPRGVLVFDVLLPPAFEAAPDAVIEEPGRLLIWRGSDVELERPGGQVEVVVELFDRTGDGRWSRRSWRMVERHYPLGELRALAAAAGLRCEAVLGQLPGGVLDGDADEARHRKAVVIARRLAPASQATGGAACFGLRDETTHGVTGGRRVCWPPSAV